MTKRGIGALHITQIGVIFRIICTLRNFNSERDENLKKNVRKLCQPRRSTDHTYTNERLFMNG